MSSSRQRRINGPPTQQPASVQPQTQGKITLPEVLQLIELRLNRLDKQFSEIPKSDNQEVLKDFVTEADSRFDMLAIEINNLKDVVMKLQSFTMEVNKKLFDERCITPIILSEPVPVPEAAPQPESELEDIP